MWIESPSPTPGSCIPICALLLFSVLADVVGIIPGDTLAPTAAPTAEETPDPASGFVCDGADGIRFGGVCCGAECGLCGGTGCGDGRSADR